MAGRNILSKSDKLQKVNLEYLYHSIRNPKPEISTLIRLLRAVKSIDGNRYAHAKKQLPYFVCGSFSPPYLSLENFSHIEHFIIEVSDLKAKGIDTEELKTHLTTDKHVQLMFLSPNQDSLKIMFTLKEKCYDIGLFSVFYTLFYKHFLELHHIDLDFSTSEASVTQACFISVDEAAYYNANAEAVDFSNYVNEDDPASLFDSMREMRHAVKDAKKRDSHSVNNDTVANDPDDEALMHIKEVLLGAASAEKDKKAIKDTDEIDSIVSGLKGFIEDHGIKVNEVKTMLHARKLRLQLDENTAEVNLFKNAKSYFAVLSPVGTSSLKLGKIVMEIVNAYLSGMQQQKKE
ncbi:MAG: hypothetical protein KBT29_05565 [Prevotellaceae bacterium]|nr:hypothetical protein [Candidatus Minthosoma caballi]